MEFWRKGEGELITSITFSHPQHNPKHNTALYKNVFLPHSLLVPYAMSLVGGIAWYAFLPMVADHFTRLFQVIVSGDPEMYKPSDLAVAHKITKHPSHR